MRYINEFWFLPDDYYVLNMLDIDYSSKRLEFAIPKELFGNQIVINKFSNVKKIFYKLKNILDDARVQKKLLKSKYLDIEKEPHKEQLSILKEQALKCREEMNKDLSPYHWDWINLKDMDVLVLYNSVVGYDEDYLLKEIYDVF